jgi:sugar phosphate isomerase/epimerase
MNRPFREFGAVLILSAVVNQGSLSAGEAAAAGKAEALSNPFFAYSVGVSDQVLRELGYTPMRYVYAGITLDKEPLYGPDVKDQIRKLSGAGAVVWLTVLGNRAKVAENDAKAVAALRELADVAAESQLKVSIYPHAGFYAATAREALRLVKQADRKNLGLTLNLCHELMADNADELPQIIQEVAPVLSVVTINGADHKKKGQTMGWDRLIQPLGRGDFDVYGHLKRLKAAGYNGPIGLQCYGLKGDPVEHLKQSMETWKTYCAKLAAAKEQPK